MGAQGRVRTCFNPDYRGSSLFSLWMLRYVLRAGEPVLYMDADVLYDWRLLDRLLGSARADCVQIARGDPTRNGWRCGSGMIASSPSTRA